MSAATDKGVLDALNDLRQLAHQNMTCADSHAFQELRATVAELIERTDRLTKSMLPTLVKQSTKNANAGFIDWRDWIALYAEANALRQTLARCNGEVR